MPPMQLHWDIFCRVVDNYGDIGVCWRLARQLAAEHGRQVRLFVDDLAALQPLCPACQPTSLRQHLQGVEVCHWHSDLPLDTVGDVVIEAFACELPAAVLAAMAVRRPVWINLEYLTAESWAESCHGMASPHPSLPLVKYFFFPGFTRSTGGLLRERDLPEPGGHDDALFTLSLFCYDTAPVGELLDALAGSAVPVRCLVPPGKPLAAVRAHLGGSGPLQLGPAEIVPIPFLPIDDYDALLRRCTVNFVRGEDSFVRAQWAGRPFVWQIYPQDDAAHLDKLDAFLDRYCAGADMATAASLRALFLAWNTGTGVAPAWHAFMDRLPDMARHPLDWRRQLLELPDLTGALVNFAAAKV